MLDTQSLETTHRGQKEMDTERGPLTNSEARKAYEASENIENRIDNEESKYEVEVFVMPLEGGRVLQQAAEASESAR